MTKNKTQETTEDLIAFLEKFTTSEQRLKDSLALLDIMKEISHDEPKMWGTSIIGFGKYKYRYESGHSGEAPLIGFSPRKSAISLYIFTGLEEHLYLLQNLGKYKMGKACIYINKLSDIDTNELKNILENTIRYLKSKYA